MINALNAAAQRASEVDIVHHHGQCEMNFHLCLGMLPGCRDGRDLWRYKFGSGSHKNVVFSLLDAAPYTSTIEIAQTGEDEPFLCAPKILVRLYHDVEMAEVIAWDQHRHWLPVYSYPNAKMYQSDEKLVLNRFLGEWLVFFRKMGVYIDCCAAAGPESINAINRLNSNEAGSNCKSDRKELVSGKPLRD